MTSLSRLEKSLELEFPTTKNLTVQGMIQEALQRMPVTGDEGTWGPLRFRVVESTDRGPLVVEINRLPPGEEESA
jgi:CBS domain containing-hemolysin-like protein